MPLHSTGQDLALDAVLDATYAIALSFTNPESLLTEPSGGSYAREVIGSGDWAASNDGVKRNSSDIFFPTATADWGSTPLRYFAIMSGSDIIASGVLNKARRIYSGYTPRFPPNSIVITFPQSE